MDCSSPYAMANLIRLEDRFQIAFGNDADVDRHGIVTPSAGLHEPEPLPRRGDRLPVPHATRVAAGRCRREDAASAARSSTASRPRSAGRSSRCRSASSGSSAACWTGRLGFGGEESAGASFLRLDGTVWTTDKDGLILDLLAAEITARTGKDPGAALPGARGALRHAVLLANRRAGDAGAEGGAGKPLAGRGAGLDARRRADHRRS